MSLVTSFWQLSGEGVIGVELNVEHCGEGFGGEEGEEKESKVEEGSGAVYISEWK